MVLRLAERLDVPLRDRNPLLLAAGYAPSYPRRALDDPAMSPVREAVDAILAGYEPYPALVVDRGWNLVAANAGVAPLTAGAAAHLLAPPVNVLRLSLHPDGLARRIANLAQWRGHVLARLAREAAAGGDDGLAELHGSWPATPAAPSRPAPSTRRGAAAAAAGRPGAVLPQHGHDVRHRAGHHRGRAEHRGVPAGRPGHRGRAARVLVVSTGLVQRQPAGQPVQRPVRRHQRVVQPGEDRPQLGVDGRGGRVRADRSSIRTRSAATSRESISPSACMPSSAAPNPEPSCPAGNRTSMPRASASICRHSGLRANPPVARTSRTSWPAARIELEHQRELQAHPFECCPDEVLPRCARVSPT